LVVKYFGNKERNMQIVNKDCFIKKKKEWYWINTFWKYWKIFCICNRIRKLMFHAEIQSSADKLTVRQVIRHKLEIL